MHGMHPDNYTRKELHFCNLGKAYRNPQKMFQTILSIKEIIQEDNIDQAKDFFAITLNCCAHNRNFDAPLHLAVILERKIIMKILLEKGAYIDVPDINGNTPLHLAVQMQNYEIVETLIKNGADINIKNDDRTSPFELAQKMFDRDMIATIIQAKAKKNRKIEESQFQTLSNSLMQQSTKLYLESQRSSQDSIKSFDFETFTETDCVSSQLKEDIEDDGNNEEIHNIESNISNSNRNSCSSQGIPAFS